MSKKLYRVIAVERDSTLDGIYGWYENVDDFAKSDSNGEIETFKEWCEKWENLYSEIYVINNFDNSVQNVYYPEYNHTPEGVTQTKRVKVMFRMWEDHDPHISEWYNSLDEFAKEYDDDEDEPTWEKWYSKNVDRRDIKIIYE